MGERGYMVDFSGGWVFLPNLPAIDGDGDGFRLKLGGGMTTLDSAKRLAVSYTSTDRKSKPQTGADNTDIEGYARSNYKQLGFHIEDLRIGEFATTTNNRIWYDSFGGLGAGISYSWVKFSTPDRTLFGVDFPGNSEKGTALTLTKESISGVHLWPTENFYISPRLEIKTSQTNHFDIKPGEWPFSPYSLEIFLGISLGFGELGNEVTKDKDYQATDIISYFLMEAHGITYNVFQHDNFNEPQAEGMELAGKVFGESEGPSGGDTWLIPSLLSLSLMMNAEGATRAIDYHLNAPGLWILPGLLGELAKGIGYTAAGSDGGKKNADYLTNGMIAFSNLATIAVSYGLDENNLFWFTFALGGAEMLLSLLIDDKSALDGMFLNSGATLLARTAQKPEYGKANFINSNTRRLHPVNYNFGQLSGLTGSYSTTKRFYDSILTTRFEIGGPWLMITNLGNFGANYGFRNFDEEKKYIDTELPNVVNSSIGIEKMIGDEKIYLNLRGHAGLSTVLKTGSSKAGGLIGAEAELGFEVFDSIFLELGASAALYLSSDVWGSIGPSIGIKGLY